MGDEAGPELPSAGRRLAFDVTTLRPIGGTTMHSSSRHTLVSVVATVSMVVMTVLLATWFPAQSSQPVPGNAATVAVLPGQ